MPVPVYAIPLGSHDGGVNAEPRWMHPHIRDKTLIRTSLRAMLDEAKSNEIDLHWPRGKTDLCTDGWPSGSAQWWGMGDWWCEAFRDVCKEWLDADRKNRKMRLYTASRQRDPFSLIPTLEYHDLDTRNAKSIQWFMTTITPWLYEVGITGIILDNSSAPDKWHGAYRAAKHLGLPVPLHMEAVLFDWLGRINWKVGSLMPFVCTSQFVLNRGNFAATQKVPEDCSATIWLTGHKPHATQEDVAAWSQNGWTLGCLDRRQDDMVFDV